MSNLDVIRQECEASLKAYAAWISPDRYYGDVHDDMFDFFQNAIESDKAEDRNALALIPRDHQKAQTLSSVIKTPFGDKTFRDVRVGDHIWGVDGKVQQVVALNPIYNMEIYEVELDDGRIIECNDEHLFTVMCPSNWGKGVEKTLPLKDIAKNYTASRYDKRNGREYTEWRYFINPCSPIEGQRKHLPIEPYTLGFWLGDGTSCRGEITTADEEALSYFPYNVKKWKQKYSYSLEGLTTQLRNNNLLSNKHIPKEYLLASKVQRECLLQGLIDSDGHVHTTNKNLSYSTTSKQLMLDVCDLVRSLGGKAKVCDSYTKPSQDGPVCHSYTINIWVPDNVTPARLKRKAERVQKGQRLQSAIKEIRYKGVEPARCIQVSNEDGLYLSNNYFVTHNSWCAAITVTWVLTKFPWFRVNYVSWSEDLVQAQRNTIQSVLRSERHRLIWPEHLNFVKERGQLKHKPKGRWNQKDIELDHPEREKRMVRDSSVRFVTAKAGSTGMHCDMTIFDDVVTDENWYGDADKKQIMRTYKSFAKIMSAGGKFLAVGTRYSPDDLYHHMLELTYTIHSTGEEKRRWSVFERVVEDSPLRDGTGTYCWPKMEMTNGEVFGFDEEELAIKKADALIDGDIGLFYGQYYNDPNNDATKIISKDCFQYLEPRFLRQEQGYWYYQGKRLKIYAGADLAWSESTSKVSKRRDWTAVCVVGVDEDGYIYVLDIARFQTADTGVYYEHIIDMHEYWGFNKITIETNSAGKIIKKNIEDEIRRYGGHLIVEGKANVSHQGKKEERIAQTLHHRYKNKTIYHNKGKYTRLLEEEIQSERPPHDDLKDCLALVVSEAVAPMRLTRANKKRTGQVVELSRFGGRRKSRRA